MEQSNEKMGEAVDVSANPAPSDTDILSSPQKPMNTFAYFFISLGKTLLKALLWVLDLVLSLFTSLWHFIKTVGLGCAKLALGIAHFFKKKAFEFRHNDWAGRLSYLFFGVSSFKNKQYFNGVLYALFEVGYIVLFALYGAHSIYMLGSLGVTPSGSDPNCDDEMFCPYINGDNSIMILIYGLLWVLSLAVFFYVWNRSIEAGYTNYRINHFLEYEDTIEESIPLSRSLDGEAKDAYQNKVKRSAFAKSHQGQVEEFLGHFESKRDRSYAASLIQGTYDASYECLRKKEKQEKKIAHVEAKKAKKLAQRDASFRLLLSKKPSMEASEEEQEAFLEKQEKFQGKTTSVAVFWDAKIAKEKNKLDEIEKRYLCYAEKESALNNSRYGRYNEYYQRLESFHNQETTYEHYEDLIAVYQNAYGKAQKKNEENKKSLLHLEQEYQGKCADIAKKYQSMRERKTELSAALAAAKADYKAKVKSIKASRSPAQAELLSQAKDELVDRVTQLMRALHEFPEDKAIKALEKEESREAYQGYRRDKKALRTDYTDASYAEEEVLNTLLVNYNLPYAEAKEAVRTALKKGKDGHRFLAKEKVDEKLSSLKAEEEAYRARYPKQYCGRPKRFKETWNTLLNEKFYITILALPVLGIVLMTILPLLFSILVAFTNYSQGHLPPTQLFTWVGWENFKNLLNPDPDSIYTALPNALLHTVGWTLIWAVLATFTNYFLGIIVALLINKKSIKLKKLWRGIFVTTIAIPQFISLLSIGVLLRDTGALGTWWWKTTGSRLGFATDTSATGVFWTRFIIVCVNIWVGIPYTILSTTGILLNIPDDLYESARVDGANAWTQFWRITMPYILFITGPYLITQFIGNINNFNVIYFLTGGGPSLVGSSLLGLGQTDLLITFLFKIVTSTNNPQYGIASAVGIIVFVICSFISIVMYNKSGAVQEEDQFQ